MKKFLRFEALEQRQCMSVIGATYDALTHTVSVERSAGDTTTDYRVCSLPTSTAPAARQWIDSQVVDGAFVRMTLHDPQGTQFRVQTLAEPGLDYLVASVRNVSEGSTTPYWDGVSPYPGGQTFNGTRIFTAGGETLYYSKAGVTSVGDLNGEGNLDLFGGVWAETCQLSQQWTTFFYQDHCEWGNVRLLATGDFNGDGSLEFIGYKDSQVNLYQMSPDEGGGGYHPPTTIATGISNPAWAAAAADFNKDGKLDLIVGSDNGKTFYFRGNGDGTFAAPVTVVPEVVHVDDPNRSSTNFCGNFYTASGDFNSDGNMDFVAMNKETGFVIMLGDGNGSFHSGVEVSDPRQGLRFFTGDFNSDGKTDLAFYGGWLPYEFDTSGDTGKLSFLMNGSSTVQTIQTPFVNVQAATIGDFNGDGHLDYAVAGQRTRDDWQSQQTAILFGSGNGTFTTQITNNPPGTDILLAGHFTLYHTVATTTPLKPAITGTNANDVIEFVASTSTLIINGVSRQVTGQFIIDGLGGHDTLRIYGASTIDMNSATGAVAYNDLIFKNMEAVEAYSLGGTAKFTGTGNDLYIASPLGAQFISNGYEFSVWGFDDIAAKGDGIARFYDAVGGGTFKAWAMAKNSLYEGVNFQRVGEGFKRVEAYAPRCTAILNGTLSDDRAVTSALGAQLFGSDYDFSAWGFDNITLNGNGGNDKADSYGGSHRILTDFAITQRA